MTKVESTASVKRLVIVTLLLCLVGLSTLQISPPLTSAQGGFGGAMLDLVPVGTTIAGALGSGSPGEFFVSGNVYQGKTTGCATTAAASDPLVNYATGATRVGTWRMWGFRSSEPVLTSSGSTPFSTNISAGKPAPVKMSIKLDSFNGTIELQGTLIGGVPVPGEAFSPPLEDTLAIVGGTGTFRSASGDAVIVPLTDASGTNCANGAFRMFLKEGFKLPRFSNVIP
jgi:hypothetical protein